MKNNLLIKLLIAATVIAVAAVVFLAIDNSGSAKVVSQPYVGMGDLHRFEAQNFVPGTYVQENTKPYYGMGDLRRLENLQATQFPE